MLMQRISQITLGALGVLGGLYGGRFLYDNVLVLMGWGKGLELAAIILPAVLLGLVGFLIAKPLLRHSVAIARS